MNQTVANASTKSTTMFFSQEIDEERLDNAKKRQMQFQSSEKKILAEQVDDLTATLAINKQIMNEMFGAGQSNNEQIRSLQQQVKLLNDEN